MKNTIIESLNWRYATKQFDASKKISAEDLHVLKESIRLTPTSLGLQAFHVFAVENPTIREELKVAANGQSQVAEASHLFVFAAKKEISPNFVDEYMGNLAKVRQIELNQTEAFGTHIKNLIAPLPDAHLIPWNAKQTYIALGFLLETAALLKIDATPMEGFDVAAVDRILNLEEKGLTSTIICPVGYRNEEDKYQYLQKVRKEESDIFTLI